MYLSKCLRSVVMAVAVAASVASVIAMAQLPAVDILHADNSDMDLSNRSSVLSFYRRLQDAAMLRCDPSGASRVLPYSNRPESGDCYSDTLGAALSNYNLRVLSDIHDQLRRDPVIVDDNF